MVKECGEEANIPPELAKRAVATGAISYEGRDAAGSLKRDVMLCYDLELPSDFTPSPVDGEVEWFQLHTVDWVVDKVLQGGPQGFKPNCNLVIIDFLIRSAS